MSAFESQLQHWQSLFNDALASHIERHYAGTDPVTAAIKYALLAGGKRVRPALCLMTAKALGGDPERALPAALAVEFVHTYSLVHDDLPCMDNDDLRRGKPTTHKVFGEAQALLAGDSLLTDAFGLIAAHPQLSTAAMVKELAHAAGGRGMVLGQSLDLYWTARQGASRADLDRIHELKTGRLLGCAAALGALAVEAPMPSVERLRRFGEGLGLAFQITDDLLDEAATTGKSAGKDKESGKLTYLAMMPPNAARDAAALVSAAAMAELVGIVTPNGDLQQFAHWLLGRSS
ncbi:MAG: polyprenyl synthetase family protein [Deltaproteobacteria bacterium]|nr:polyprenyl synthetase family protein [Deltaproteobacteria bacterium]